MVIQTSSQFENDFRKLSKENAKFASKAMELVFGAMNAITSYNDPLHGLGHPEPLKENLAGCHSRQITEKHRLVYRYNDDKSVIQLISCYGHYI